MYTDGGARKTARAVPGDWFDAVFMGAAMLTGLLPVLLKTFTGVFFILLTVLYAYYRLPRMERLVARVWPILTIGVWSVVSALWSPYPGYSVYYGLQLWLTIIVACMLGGGTEPRHATYGLFGALFIHGCLVFTNGYLAGDIDPFSLEPSGFVGIAGSKNTTADMAALGIMSALAMLAVGVTRVRPVEVFLALFLLAIDGIIVFQAHSAGAYAGLAVSVTFFFAWWAMRPLPIPARTAVVALAGIAGAIAVATRSVWYAAVFERYLAIAGKEDNLTGRTYIWSRAEVLIQQHPWFGRGFSSFWVEGDLEPIAIWDTMYVHEHAGFNFHNSVYEILVYFGYAGLFAMGAIILFYSAMLARRLVLDPQPITIMFAALIAYDALRFNFESLPLGVFAHSTLFLYGALAHGAGLELRARKEKPKLFLPARLRFTGQRPLRTGI